MTVKPGVLDSMEHTLQHQTVFDTDQQYLGDVYAKALLAVSVQKSGNTLKLCWTELERGGSSRFMNELPKLQVGTLESPRVPMWLTSSNRS